MALQEMGDASKATFEDGTITVCVRARPLVTRELKQQSTHCLQFTNGKRVQIFEQGLDESNATKDVTLQGEWAPRGSSRIFSFDHAYAPEVGQETVYNDIGKPMLESSFKGFNTCVFAYGQTGSGKSYCMMGPEGGRQMDSAPGLIPRLCENLFKEIEERKRANALQVQRVREEIAQMKDSNASNDALKSFCSKNMPPELDIVVYVSYIEIYREKVRCLLHSDASSANLKVRQHPSLGVYVEGLKEVPVSHTNQIIELMRAGNRNRHTAATGMNDVSSRSHAIFALQLIQMRKSVTKNGASATTELCAKINLVDLAGSERAKSTGAEGETLKEGAQINKSLSTLGLVISTLAENNRKGQSKHVPYRDSTLTFLLRESLGGNSKTFMLSTVSPATANYEETLSTLRYADRAKSIVTRAFINETASDKRIRELEDEVTRLREKIRILQERDLSHLSIGVQPASPSGIATIYGRGRDGLCGARVDAAAFTHDTLFDQSVHLGDSNPPTGTGEVARWAPSSGEGSERSSLSFSATKNAVCDATGRSRSLSPDSYSNEQESQDVNVLKSEVEKMEEIMRQLTATNAEREQEVSAVLEAYKAQSTVRINRNDPYLLNLDGVGGWVVAHLVGSKIFLGDYSSHILEEKDGCKDSDSGGSANDSFRLGASTESSENSDLETIKPPPEAGQPSKTPKHKKRRQFIVLSANDYADPPGTPPPSIGAPHCVLCAQLGNSFSLQPCASHETYVNGHLLPVSTCDYWDPKSVVILQSGDVISLGLEGPQLKFVDPTVTPMTARGRRPIYHQSTAFLDAPAIDRRLTGAPSSSEATTKRVSVPSLTLKACPRPVLNARPSIQTRRGATASGDDSSLGKSGVPRVSNLPPPSRDSSGTQPGADDVSSPNSPASPSTVGPSARPVVPVLQLGALVRPNQLFATKGPVLATGGGLDGMKSPCSEPCLFAASAGLENVKKPPSSSRVARTPQRSSILTSGVLEGRVVSCSTTDRASVRFPSKASIVKGTPVMLRGTSIAPPSVLLNSSKFEFDPERFIGRHNFVFLGPVQSGKTTLQENLKLPNRWYSFLKKDKLRVTPTWGIRRSQLTVEGSEDIELLFTELSGLTCFSILHDQLPTRRVTYMLCFSLSTDNPSLQIFNQILEFILCNSDHRDSSVVLVATHIDKCRHSEQDLYTILESMGQQVHNFFQLLQPNAELRPTIVARFAVDNVNRKVFSAGFSKMRTITDLLNWMSDHALHRCKNDIDFLNGRIPLRCEKLRAMVTSLRTTTGKWCISLSDYKNRAKEVDRRYGQKNDLHVHTQLLAHAGILKHRFRHTEMRKFVIIDVDWYLRLLTCVACCGSISKSDPDLMVLCASDLMRRFQETGLLPFNWMDVIAADQYCLLSKGIITAKVYDVLISKILSEKDVERPSPSGILDLLRCCDYIIMGSRLCFSPSPLSLSIRQGKENINGAGGKVEECENQDMLDPRLENFFLLPTNFFHRASPAVIEYLPRLLTGPFYRFTFNMVPLHFFSKVTCRLAYTTARAVYIGPVQEQQVEADVQYMPSDDSCDANISPCELLDDSKAQSLQQEPTLASENPKMAVIPGDNHFWQEAIWALGPAGNRAFIRMVHHSLFISFYSTTELSGRDITSNDAGGAAAMFFDSLLRVVREVVQESPGAQCQEGLLCAMDDYDDASWPFLSSVDQENETTCMNSKTVLGSSRDAFSEQSSSCYYCTVDENINSFDKIREVEQFALQTARYRRSHKASCTRSKVNGSDQSDVEVNIAPLLRNFTTKVNVGALISSVEADVGPPSDPKLKETLQQALIGWNQLHLVGVEATSRRNSDSRNIAKHREKLGHAIDIVVDTLARWWAHTVEGNVVT
ncbi:unnamed protein product [Phytomonas sp. EM1]|nr:unnamed protein product [Phytomonas sp. EM1]|eukprot:CCW60914.1 unnamed protein product [Phytomonas sp. isolate EM1]